MVGGRPRQADAPTHRDPSRRWLSAGKAPIDHALDRPAPRVHAIAVTVHYLADALKPI
jgi:hypothetical protein